MARNERLLNGYLATGATVMTGITAGTITGGNTLPMHLVKTSTLSATVTVDAETNTITISALWEVSNDDTTWVRCTPLNNAAIVVLATGTAGADTAVARVIAAPDSAYGWRYARCSVLNLVADGLIADTYAIGYNFEKEDLAA